MSRVIVFGLDGVPCSLLRRLVAEGVMPEMGKLLQAGDLTGMRTVYPPLSSVSWTTFATGVNPGAHRIFGFFEAQIDAYGIWFQNLEQVKVPGLWDYTQAHGRRTISINLPGTYPAPPFNGVMVSGFIAPDLERSVYPKVLRPVLEQVGYMLDVPADQPAAQPEKFWTGCHASLNARAQTIGALLQHEPFDLMVAVLTETDRVHHFFFDALEEPHHPQRPEAYRFYRRVDELLGEWMRHCRDDDEVVILADHGFCRIDQEIYINHWLKEHGYLKMKSEEAGVPLSEIDPARSRAFALDPGRIFLNVRGRQAEGCVDPADAEALREEIAVGLAALEITVPWSAQRFRPIRKVWRREEIYVGPWTHLAADLVLDSHDGYEMKGKFNHPVLSDAGVLTGMHTFDDAMLYIRGRRWAHADPEMLDVAPTLLHLMDLPVPPVMTGRVLLNPDSTAQG